MNFKANKVFTSLFISAFSLSALAQPSLEEIVVTATKRETNLIDTPISISVVSDSDLKQRHVQSLMDLSDGSVPGLNIAPFESRQSALTVGIRGIVPLDANQPAREQGVGVYIDGIYLGRQHGLNASLLDLERIEVLKGPQGTLFGRNTEGGALSIVTKKPTGEFDVRLNSGVGSYSSNNADFHINLPTFLGVSTKIDAITQYQDATTKNPLSGEAGWNYYERNGIRITNRLQTDTITLDYTFDQGTDKSTPFYSQLLNYNPLNLSNVTPLPAMVEVNGTSIMKVADIGVPQQPSVAETGGHGINLTWNVSDLLEFRSLTAYRFVDSTQWDNAGGAHRVPVAKANSVFSRYSVSELNQTQFSQEFQLVGSTGSFDYVTGVYYFIEDASEWASTPSTNTWNSDLKGYTINNAMLWQPGNMFIDRDSKATAKSSAVFGQVVYTPEALSRLHVTLGGRYTKDDKNGVLEKVRNIQADLPFEENSARFNPLAIVSYEITDNINTYIKYATGYRSGGASSRSLTFRSFGPEDNISYEIGMKGDFFNRVRINAAAYTMERTGSQIDFSQVAYDPVTKSSRNTLETMNAPGITEIKGLEIDSTVAITENLSIKAAYTYTDTLVPATINPFKNQLQPVFIVFTPENVYNLAIDYTTYFDNFSVVAHVDANASDAAYAFSEFDLKNDSTFITNASLTFEGIQAGMFGNLEFNIWVRNLLDGQYVFRRDPSNDATLGTYGNFNAPRTFGITLGYAM
jgi:iron complex outermembrane receptor protein